jgi:hypothetical protein
MPLEVNRASIQTEDRHIISFPTAFQGCLQNGDVSVFVSEIEMGILQKVAKPTKKGASPWNNWLLLRVS